MSAADRKTYVLDTSVLLADPAALGRFAEHEVIIPVAVIGELETKRDHPELGYFARAALRYLDDLRITHGRLDRPLKITPEGGTLSVELNHTDLSSLPHGFLRDGAGREIQFEFVFFHNFSSDDFLFEGGRIQAGRVSHGADDGAGGGGEWIHNSACGNGVNFNFLGRNPEGTEDIPGRKTATFLKSDSCTL